ncbi:unnamed protein product [Diabrotica balteata]|uniref:Uncharacterized protein n=1 Tax=Diabrotica balteata TaxID=107213 RepID=A0A9N9SV83_DIABA|nr:unnamed protein product [Diabrotica balteata]
MTEDEIQELMDSVETDSSGDYSSDDPDIDPDYEQDEIAPDDMITECIREMQAGETSDYFIQNVNMSLNISDIETPAASSTMLTAVQIEADECVESLKKEEAGPSRCMKAIPSTSVADVAHAASSKPKKRPRSPLPIMEDSGPLITPSIGGFTGREIKREFDERFSEFDALKPDLELFNNPMGVNIQNQSAEYQLELCELQSDSFFQAKKNEDISTFWNCKQKNKRHIKKSYYSATKSKAVYNIVAAILTSESDGELYVDEFTLDNVKSNNIVIPFAITLLYQRPGLMQFYPEFLTGPKTYLDFKLTYSKSHTRATPYFVGMFAGYIYYQLKGSNKHVCRISLALSDIVLAFITALVLYLLVEAPFRKVLREIMMPSKDKTPKPKNNNGERHHSVEENMIMSMSNNNVVNSRV